MKKLPFHTFLFAIYPVLALFASNISQVLIADVLRSFTVSILLAAVLFAILFSWVRDWRKAGLISSAALLLFFSYGHVFNLLQGISIGSILIGRTLIIAPLFVIAFAVWLWWVLIRLSVYEQLTSTFNFVGIFLVVFPFYTVVAYYSQAEIIRASHKSELPAAMSQRFQGKLPNVYYIILDMHGRADVLDAIYGYDEMEFVNSLKENGFYIASESTSNYSSTLQSISSSLNMEYVNYLEDIYGADEGNREPLSLLLEQNKVMKVFKERGYKIGAFQTDDFSTEFRDADLYIKPSKDQVIQYQSPSTLNSFEGIFLQTTMVRMLYDLSIVEPRMRVKTIETAYQLHRLTILNAVDHLPDFAGEKDPYFVFLHIVSPHPPYVFGANGEELFHSQPFSLSGPDRKSGGATYIKLYIDQLQYTDKIVLQAVKKIFANSKTPPIIIIQGDHGPVSYNGEDEVGIGNMKEQHAILNAYYFPDQKYDFLYPSISPVNSFRVVFNTFFGDTYDFLPDRNYFLPHARPYDFIDVTERVKTDPLIP
jgi:hypothetical protein